MLWNHRPSPDPVRAGVISGVVVGVVAGVVAGAAISYLVLTHGVPGCDATVVCGQGGQGGEQEEEHSHGLGGRLDVTHFLCLVSRPLPG